MSKRTHSPLPGAELAVGDGESAANRKLPEHGFWSLIVTQFQGAFSDNVLKNLVVFLIVATGMSLSDKHRIGELVGALFALPFILFSMAGGYLADRFSKRAIAIGVKVFEIAVMVFATAGLALNHLPMQLAAVFLMGTHSAFFGPSKYGLLPELLPEKRLSWGNGILELGTFTAIILGTVAAGIMAEQLRGSHLWSGLILTLLAALGLLASLGITRVPPADPNRQFKLNFLAEVRRQVGLVKNDRPLVLALIGNTYFNFLGALFLLNIFFYGSEVLRVSEANIGLLNVALAMGIGTGSVAAGYLSGGKIEYGLVPLGAMGLTVSGIALSFPGLSYSDAMLRLGLLGFTGGFFIVPICALLQHRPDKKNKGGLLATANWFSFVGVFLASGAHYAFTSVVGLSPEHIFLAGGLLTLAGAVYALWLLPDALLRFGLWVLTRSIYRIRVEGRDHIPERGGALFVCNHLSQVDALLLLASTDRRIRFIMYKGVYELPWIKPLARTMGVIPISSELRPREMIQSLKAASVAIQAGEVVCIFAEGQITRIGQMLPFRRGFERIMKDVDAPIIPVALDGVWGSIFSFERGRFLWKWPRRIPYPVTVNFGKPMPASSTPVAVRQAVQELNADAWRYRRSQMLPLHRAFVRTARRHPFRFAMADAQTPKVTFGSALTRSVFLARRLRPLWNGQTMVGLLLPPTVPGALVNFAALLSGKVPVNLNYTVSESTLASCVRQCDLKTVITSKAFLDQIKLNVPCHTVLLEEVVANPQAGEKIGAWILAKLLPVRMLVDLLSRVPPHPNPLPQGEGNTHPVAAEGEGALISQPLKTVPPLPEEEGRGEGERALRNNEHRATARSADRLDDLATIIFSSGSTGDPKGVMLSHYNIGANIEQLGQTFALGEQDRVLGVLPFFHSFGFTGTLCLPAVLGVGVVYHPNPLDARGIGELVRDHGVTMLLATPTFLQIYMRGCSPEQFGSLQFVLVGAEKLPDRVANAFEEQFGARPFEAYGCTECAPAVTVNTRDFRAAGFRQVGAKRGKIGHPLPGVSVRIVDPETHQTLPLGQAGLLLVRGPNVMQGYLGRTEKTAEVLRDGWYVTGDIATLDEDGFLEITDRLSRFSKIGGEMVPHIKVEEKLHEAAGVTDQSFAVTGVPDEKKGERLIVLHTLSDERLKAALEKFAQTDLPNLWKPRADQFYGIDKLPYLGTGKLDLRRIRELAVGFASAAK
ncbi:MAG: MFS transporter [Verrucomicrobia bacterium]|nr:MFS transporter [Verrucomicrobiota bacterium]